MLGFIKYSAFFRRCKQKGVERAIQDEIDVFGPKILNETETIMAVISSRQRREIRKMLELSPQLVIVEISMSY